eukprot:354251-Chlamydomonas_euryale.AAC.1
MPPQMQEAFVKIREQAKAYLDRQNELQAGANILATSNLDYFQPHHQSEVFRLKGMFQQALDDSLEAHTSFSTSLCLWKQNADAWLAWGQHCDRSYEAACQQAAAYQQQLATAAVQKVPPPPPPSAPLQPSNYLEYAVYCYLQVGTVGEVDVQSCYLQLGK